MKAPIEESSATGVPKWEPNGVRRDLTKEEYEDWLLTHEKEGSCFVDVIEIKKAASK